MAQQWKPFIDAFATKMLDLTWCTPQNDPGRGGKYDNVYPDRDSLSTLMSSRDFEATAGFRKMVMSPKAPSHEDFVL
jgi:hypothetical protein